MHSIVHLLSRRISVRSMLLLNNLWFSLHSRFRLLCASQPLANSTEWTLVHCTVVHVPLLIVFDILNSIVAYMMHLDVRWMLVLIFQLLCFAFVLLCLLGWIKCFCLLWFDPQTHISQLALNFFLCLIHCLHCLVYFRCIPILVNLVYKHLI